MKTRKHSPSTSKVMRDAEPRSVAEDANDLAEFEKRRNESVVDFESVVRSMRRNGK